MKQYGYTIPNLLINGKLATYGVVNERAVRASAGLMFTVGFAAFLHTLHTHNIHVAITVVAILFVDFFLKVVFGPKYSFFSQAGNLLVYKQPKEYVGALQKRFAWGIGLVFSLVVLLLMLSKIQSGEHAKMMLDMGQVAAHSIPPLSHLGLPFFLCAVCLVFMWMESVLGFCVGCYMYAYLKKNNYITSTDNDPVCKDNVCEI